jgi:hypothetical protein
MPAAQRSAGSVEVFSHPGQCVGYRIEHSIILCDNRFSVELF